MKYLKYPLIIFMLVSAYEIFSMGKIGGWQEFSFLDCLIVWFIVNLVVGIVIYGIGFIVLQFFKEP